MTATTTRPLATVWVADVEFLLPDRDRNPLDIVSPWWGLGTYLQGVLAWVCETGGLPPVSILPGLRGLLRDGLAVVDEHGAWSATDAGHELYASRLGGDAA